MERRPRALSDPVLDRLGGTLIVAISTTSAAFALVLFGYVHLVVGDAAAGRSIVFASFALNSMVYIFAYRSLSTPVWRMSPTANRPLLWAVVVGWAVALLGVLRSQGGRTPRANPRSPHGPCPLTRIPLRGWSLDGIGNRGRGGGVASVAYTPGGISAREGRR